MKPQRLFLADSLVLVAILSALTDALQDTALTHSIQQQRLNNNNQQPLELYGQALESTNHNLPGHYAFEVAPHLEPPQYPKKPPYQLSSSTCSGLNLFNAFSANDTLCGDLNSGFIPQNPLQQVFDGQPYPFELIKNKTLNFFAKALPVLKSEYESIPKVARLAPAASQVLNPTSIKSTLSHEQLHELNSQGSLGLSPEFADSVAPSFVRRQRKKRSTSSTIDTNAPVDQDLNATVFTSAHSVRVKPVITQHTTRNQPTSNIITSNNNNKGHYTTNYQQHDQNEPPNQVVDSTLVVTTSGASSKQTARKQETKQRQQVTARSSGSDQVANRVKLAASASQQPSPSPSPTTTSTAATTTSTQRTGVSLNQANTSASSATAKRNQDKPASLSPPHVKKKLSPCHDLGFGFGLIACQAASSLINGDKAPIWLQLVKQYASSSTDSPAASTSASSSPISSLWSGLINLMTIEQPLVRRKESSAPATVDTSFSHDESSQGPAYDISTMFSSLSSLLPDSFSGQSRGSNDNGNDQTTRRSDNPSSASTYNDKKMPNSNSGNKLGSTFSSILAPFAVGVASSKIAEFVDYIMPTSFRRSASGGNGKFARRKAPMKPQRNFYQDTSQRYDLLGGGGGTPLFVESPAFASAASASAIQRATMSAAAGTTPPLIAKQPPTPCQSTEEYISPTFARNYQGAWKYVVQIPHEGYFTQTIQRTSCVKSRCEFTEGACHEAPRWVSLLVAEIFYPNAVFSSAASSNSEADLLNAGLSMNNMPASLGVSGVGGLPNAPNDGSTMMASASNLRPVKSSLPPAGQYQQQQVGSTINAGVNINQRVATGSSDMIQMPDSQQAYNVQLGNAIAQLATELNINPNDSEAIQRLADAYSSYQFAQRHGHIPSNNPSAQVQGQVNHNQQQRQQSSISSSHALPSSIQNSGNRQAPQASQMPQHVTSQLPQVSPQVTTQKQYLQQVASQQQQLAQQNDYANLLAQAIQQNPQFAALYEQTLNSVTSQGYNFGNKRRKREISSAQQSNKLYQQALQKSATQSQSSNTNQNKSQVKNAQQQQQHLPQQTTTTTTGDQQVECDGHDNYGCYVIRVYYDWFLINGSCKCWKTQPLSPTNSNTNGGSNTSPVGGNKFLKRFVNIYKV